MKIRLGVLGIGIEHKTLGIDPLAAELTNPCLYGFGRTTARRTIAFKRFPHSARQGGSPTQPTPGAMDGIWWGTAMWHKRRIRPHRVEKEGEVVRRQQHFTRRVEQCPWSHQLVQALAYRYLIFMPVMEEQGLSHLSAPSGHAVQTAVVTGYAAVGYRPGSVELLRPGSPACASAKGQYILSGRELWVGALEPGR
jgi:hypothetical protein